jgi:plastocyanin
LRSIIVIFVLTFALLGLLLGYAALDGRQTENPNGNVPIENPPKIELPVSIVPGSSSKTSDAYSPNPVNIRVGDTIVWTNNDTQPHTVTSGSNAQPDGKFDSSPNFNPILAPEATFSHTFTEAGEYPYYCGLHPNMVGTVIIA